VRLIPKVESGLSTLIEEGDEMYTLIILAILGVFVGVGVEMRYKSDSETVGDLVFSIPPIVFFFILIGGILSSLACLPFVNEKGLFVEKVNINFLGKYTCLEERDIGSIRCTYPASSTYIKEDGGKNPYAEIHWDITTDSAKNWIPAVFIWPSSPRRKYTILHVPKGTLKSEFSTK